MAMAVLSSSNAALRLIRFDNLRNIVNAPVHHTRRLAGTEAAATFLIDDAYISPGWYPSKQDAGRVVPTWNYIAVEARGQMEVVEDAEGLLALLEPLTAAHENHRPRPWTVAEAPADYLAALLKGIVGIRMVAPVLTGAWKLDQKKAAADRLGAAAGLRRDEGAEGIAGWMEQV